jgi:signal transduction histidine kinase
MGLGSGDSGKQREILQNVVPVVQQTMNEVRGICTTLRPSTLDDLGLIPTFRWFIRNFQAVYPHIQVDLDIRVEEAQVPDPFKTDLFRITQEAMNNAAKHAQPHTILVALGRSGSGLELTIRDDGRGFDPRAPRQPSATGGFGLLSMRERAELQDGSLEVRSQAGQGTTITARLPLPGEAAPESSALPREGDAVAAPGPSAVDQALLDGVGGQA